MTMSLVTGLNSMQNLVTGAKMNVTSDVSSNFSDVLKDSTEKKTVDEPSKTAESDMTAVKEDKPVRDDSMVKSEGKGEKVQKQDNAKNPVENNKPEELTEEEIEAVADVATEMVQIVAELLDIPTENVEAAMQELGIEDMEILNPAIIPELVVEITGAADAMEIMTDEELFTDVKELMTEAEDLMDQLSQELEIPVEDLKKQIQNTVEAVKSEDKPVIEKETNETFDNILTESKEVLDMPKANNSSEGSNLKQNRDDSKPAGNENVTQFTQTVTDTIKETFTARVDEAPVSYVTDTDSIMEQVTESLKLTMKEDMTEMEMELHPASLGNVKVQVASKDGVITANFTTQNESVRAALESQIVQLKEQMNEQGLKVAEVEVTVSSHAFERNLDEEGQNRSGEDQSKPNKRGRRSITLDGIDDADGLFEDEGDQIVADMMARSGNTVDYLA